MPTVADDTWSPLKSGGVCLRSRTWPAGDLGLAERDEIEAAGLADELADGFRIGDAGELDDDAVGALGDDDRLGDAGLVHPPFDDVLDDRHVAGRRRVALDRDGLIFDPKTARQVEPELGLDRAPAIGGRGIGETESRPEVDDQGKDADEQDKDRTGSTHRGGILHGMPVDRLRSGSERCAGAQRGAGRPASVSGCMGSRFPRSGPGSGRLR